MYSNGSKAIRLTLCVLTTLLVASAITTQRASAGRLTTTSLAAVAVDLGCEATAYVHTGTNIRKIFSRERARKLQSKDHRKFKTSDFRFVCSKKSLKLSSKLSTWGSQIKSRDFIRYLERFGFTKRQIAQATKSDAVKAESFEFKTELLVNASIRRELRRELVKSVRSFPQVIDVLSEDAMLCEQADLDLPTTDEILEFFTDYASDSAQRRYLNRLLERGRLATENFVKLVAFLYAADYSAIETADVKAVTDYFGALKKAIDAYEKAANQLDLLQRISSRQLQSLKAKVEDLESRGAKNISPATLLLLARETGIDTEALAAAECQSEAEFDLLAKLVKRHTDYLQ